MIMEQGLSALLSLRFRTDSLRAFKKWKRLLSWGPLAKAMAMTVAIPAPNPFT